MKLLLSLVISAVLLVAGLFGIDGKPIGGSDKAAPTNSASVFFENAWRVVKLTLARGILAVYEVMRTHFVAPPLQLALISTAPRNTDERLGQVVAVPMAAEKIYAGALVAINATGYAANAANTASFAGFGRAEETVDNSGGSAGDLTIDVKRGVFKFANSATNALTQAHVGTIAIVEDNETVASSASNSVKAGLVVEIETDGVWIDTRAFLPVVGTVADDAVVTAKIADDAVTGAKLANAISDLIRTTTCAVANTGTPDGVAHITGQVKDSEGNALTGRHLVQVFLSATSYGAATDLGTLTALTNSILIKEITDDAIGHVVTHTDGSWGLELDTANDGDVYAHAVVLGLHVVANAAITGNA